LQKLGKDWQLSKQAAQKFNVEKFKLKKLNELEVRKQYQIKISNRCAALVNLSDSENVNRVWENIQENIKTSVKERLGLYELKQHKPWFDEKCSGFLVQRKQVKNEWLQDPNQTNVDNLKNVRREAGIHFRNKKKEHLTTKINVLETNSKMKYIRDLYRGINDFNKGYQSRTNKVKKEKVIWLQTPTTFWLGEGNISLSCSMYMG